MQIKTVVNPEEYTCGVLVGRFQVAKLHDGHRALIDKVVSHHKKVVIFLGVPRKSGSKSNPLPFAARKLMIQEEYPNIVILPLQDMRSDSDWSKQLDNLVTQPYGNQKFLLYGSRDSFISHYSGRFDTTELITDIFYSGTQARKLISEEIGASEDWRAGVIHATYDRYPVTYPTVDIIPYQINPEGGGKILLAQKPNETKWRMVGGFVDRTDSNWEAAAKRELFEEVGQIEVGNMEYVTSGQVDDWRYNGCEDGIMTTVFKCKYVFGTPKPNDDIHAVKWFTTDELTYDYRRDIIVPEHIKFLDAFFTSTRFHN